MVFKKSLHMKQWLLRNPWIRPISVFNYAVTRIQAWVRRFIIRSRVLRTGKPFPPRRIRRKVSRPRQLNKYLKFLDRYRDFAGKKPDWLNTGFSSWCAVRIQAAFRMYRIRRRYNLRCHLVNQVAAIVMQTFWKNCRYQILDHLATQSLHRDESRHLSNGSPKSPKSMTPQIKAVPREDNAVFCIQRCWRGFCNRRIYRYFRDMIVERLSAAPIELLRNIIPNESAAFDRAAGTHVRFRLGGWIFPPKVYYKVYTHRPLCDVGAFAPRDYTEEKEETATFTNTKLASIQGYKTGRIKVGTRFFEAVVTTTNPSGTKKWYRREENNGWRPIASQLFSTVKRPPWFQAEPTREKVRHFHYNSQYRKELKEKQRAKIKKRWMKKFFDMSRRQEPSNFLASGNEGIYSTSLEDKPDICQNMNFLGKSVSEKALKHVGNSEEFFSSVAPPSHLQLFPGISSGTSFPGIEQLLQEQKEKDGIQSRGNSGKARHGANYRRGPPVRMPGYLRKDDGEDGKQDGRQDAPAFDFFQYDAVADLLNWSRTLDYEEYAKEWAYVGCSKPSEYSISQQPALILGANK